MQFRFMTTAIKWLLLLSGHHIFPPLFSPNLPNYHFKTFHLYSNLLPHPPLELRTLLFFFFFFEEMETIRRTLRPSSYCLLPSSTQVYPAFLPVLLDEISVLPAKANLSICALSPTLSYSRNSLPQFSLLSCEKFNFQSPLDHYTGCHLSHL